MQLNLQWPNIMSDSLPDNSDINVEVAVDEAVPRVCDCPPRDTWMLRSPVYRQLRRSLTQDFKATDNRILFLGVLPELRLCRSLDIVTNPSDAIEHFAQKNVWGAWRGR